MYLQAILKKLNNIKIRNKFLAVYILCLAIPVGVIYFFLFRSIWDNVNSQSMYVNDLSMDRIRLQLSTEIEQCVQINEMINLNKRLNQALDTLYASPNDYIEEYKAYLEKELDYYRIGFRQIDNITIYTDNYTIVNGGNYSYLSDSLKKNPSIAELFSQDQYFTLFTGAMQEHQNEEYISLLGKNYFYPGKFQKLIRIDLNQDMLKLLAKNEQIEGNIYLYSGDNQCLMSYIVDKSLFYDPKNQEPLQGTFQIEKKFGSEGLMAGWKLIGVFPNQNQWDIFFASGSKTIMVAVLIFLLGTVIILIISYSIVQRLNVVSNYLQSPEAANHEPLHIQPGNDEIGTMIHEMNKQTVRSRMLIDMVYKRELEKTKAELHALQSQIQPHFLYNTLNSIRLKCLLDASPDAAEMVKRLAVLLRRTIGWINDVIPMKEEINSIIDFLEIQKFRYADKLNYIIDVSSEALSCKIPKLSLQPLVENSSFHGTELSDKNGLIQIWARKYGENIKIIIRDNGIGIPKQKLYALNKSLLSPQPENSENIGLQNVARRLRYYYGPHASIRVVSIEEKGTAVIVQINEVPFLENP